MATAFRPGLVRHYCKTCNARLFPFDVMESKTEAPINGKTILLKSHNAHNREGRISWCWTCKEWKTVNRITEKDILEMYVKRNGVIVRGLPPTKVNAQTYKALRAVKVK